MGGEIPSLSPEQALSAERQPQEYAAVMARAVRESRPKVLRSMLHPGYADIAHQPYVVVGEQRIHIGTEQPVTHTPAGLVRQARMRYGIRVGDAEHVATSTTEIAQALGERAKNATAPVLFELARQYNKLSQKTIQEADELGIATVATTTRPDNSTYTTIYFADGPSGKVIRLQLDNLPSKVTITPHQLTEIRKEIASHREVLATIPQQALTVHIEDEGESMTFSAPTGNVWRVETTPPQQMPEAVTPEESEATGYAEEYIAQAEQVSDADLQRRSDEVGREIGEVLSLPEEEVVRRRGLLREWMASRGYEVPVNYAYQHTYLMLSSQEKADFQKWMQEREEAGPTGVPTQQEKKPEEEKERTEGVLEIVPLLIGDIASAYMGTMVIGDLDSHTGKNVFDQPASFRLDHSVAQHGGLSAFWQEHGGDFGNGVIETAGLQMVFAGLAFAFARGRVTYETLTRLRLLAAGLSMLSVLFYEIRPLADFTNQHIMNIGSPDVLDAPAGVLGAGTPTVIDAALSKYLQLRGRRRVKRRAAGKMVGIEGVVEDILHGVNKVKARWQSIRGNKRAQPDSESDGES